MILTRALNDAFQNALYSSFTWQNSENSLRSFLHYNHFSKRSIKFAN
jgi:hypothetical protein